MQQTCWLKKVRKEMVLSLLEDLREMHVKNQRRYVASKYAVCCHEKVEDCEDVETSKVKQGPK